jgi:N-acetyl sugar amidotransferase
MRYCRSCILPDTRPNLMIGDDGVCNACKSHGGKREVDWRGREALFRQLVDRARGMKRDYDCLIPVSGGKDSTWQTLKCLEYGLRPLTFSYAPPLRTALGRDNLDNLIELGVDHIDYRINPRIERTFLRRAFERYGNVGVPMHAAIFSIARILAARFRIPMIVWGEDSSVEYGGKKDEGEEYELNQAWLRKFGVNHGACVDDWIDDELTREAMFAYSGVPDEDLAAAGTISLFLGYFFEWDPETTRAAAMAAGMKARDDGPRVGYWNYADLDDELISVHHYLKWHKFGFTRLFDNLSVEIRNGRLTRPEAVEIVRASGDQTPDADIEAFCAFARMSRSSFDAVADGFRSPAVWTKADGVWRIPGFLIDDWVWR